MMKRCQRCKKEKSLDEFALCSRSSDRLQPKCRECDHEIYLHLTADQKEARKEYNKIFHNRHRSEIKERQRKYRELNADKIAKRMKIWRAYKKEHIKSYERNKARTNFAYRISKNIRAGIYASLTSGKNGESWQKILGYSVRDLMKRMESMFDAGMSWDNYGEWHIDHIIPIASFRFSSIHDDEFKKCWALTNLQPLWKLDNLKKGASRVKYSPTEGWL